LQVKSTTSSVSSLPVLKRFLPSFKRVVFFPARFPIPSESNCFFDLHRLIKAMMEWFCPAFLTREREIGERIVGFQERDSLDQTSTFPPLHHRHPVTKTTSAASEEGKRPTG